MDLDHFWILTKLPIVGVHILRGVIHIDVLRGIKHTLFKAEASNNIASEQAGGNSDDRR